MTSIPTIDSWRESGEWISVNEHKIFTVSCGVGEPVLVLHGFPTASFDYARLVPLLADRYRLVLFDFLGFGFSDKPRPHDYSLFEQADIAQAVAAHFGLKRTFILTHDMGNSVALEILKRGDPVVDKLVMLNGSMLLKYYRSLLSQKLLLHPIFGPVISALRLIRRPVFARQFRSLFATQPSELEIDTFWSLIRYNDGLGIYHRLIKYLNERKIHEHTWLDVLEAHHTALTIIWGQHDSVSVSRIGEYLVELRPDATYYPLAATGHYPQWEAPERLAEILRTALG